MLKITRHTLYSLFLAIFFMANSAPHAQAASCSPGIPCTGYNVYTNANDNNAKTGSGTCDANFMNQIYSRAFMEANREIIMSEQIIHKPDSVLEYTCFDQFVSMAAHNAGPIFSESDYWQGMVIEKWTAGYASTYVGVWPDHFETEIINNTGANDGFADQLEWSVFSDVRLDNILESFLLPTLQNYIDENFDHTFLGEGTTIDNTINSSIGANSYNCSHMSTVWTVAKCLDFGEDDRFRSFESLVLADPRSIPEECSPGKSSSDTVEFGANSTKLDVTSSGSTSPTGGMPSGGLTSGCPAAGAPVLGVITDFSNDIINVSNNCDNGANDFPYASFYGINTFFNIAEGYDDPDIPCSSPLPTGVPIITYNLSNSTNADNVLLLQRSYEFHYDHICPNAGCYYAPNKVPYTWGDPIPSTTTGECLPF